MNRCVGVFPLFFFVLCFVLLNENNVACIIVQCISLNLERREKRASSAAGKQGNANSLSKAVRLHVFSVILLNKQYMQIMFFFVFCFFF